MAREEGAPERVGVGDGRLDVGDREAGADGGSGSEVGEASDGEPVVA